MHHTVLVWLSFVGIVLTDAEISIQSTTLAPFLGPLGYTGAPFAYHPFRNQPSPFYPEYGPPSDYQAELTRNSIRVPVSFNPRNYQQDNYFRPIPVPVSYDPNSQLLPNPYQTRNNLFVNSFSNRAAFSGFSTPVPVLVKTPFDFALQSTPRPFRIAHTPEPYYSSPQFPYTTQATPVFNPAESLPVIINNGYRKHPKAHINRLPRPGITRYSTTPFPDIQSTTSLPSLVDIGYQNHAKSNFNNVIRPDITSYSTIPFPVTTQATPTVNYAESLPVIIDNGFKKHPKSKLNHLIRPDIAKYLVTPTAAAITTQATPIDSAKSIPVIINRGYKKHPKTNVDHLIRPDLKTYSTIQLPQNNIQPSALPRYYPIPGAVQFTSNFPNQSHSPNAVKLNSNSLNLAQPSIPVQSPVPPQLNSNSPNQAYPSLPEQLTTISQGATQSPIPAQVAPNSLNQGSISVQFASNSLNQAQTPVPFHLTSNSQNQAQQFIPEQFTSNSLDQSQPTRPLLSTSYSPNQSPTPLKVQLLSSNSLTQSQQVISNSQNQEQSLFTQQLDSTNLNQVQPLRPVQSPNIVQLTSNSQNQAQNYNPVPPFSNSQNQGQSPLRTYSLVSPSNGRQVLVSNPSLLQKMIQFFKKGDQSGSVLTSSAVFPKPDLGDSTELSLDDSYAKTIAYITSLLRAHSEKEPLVYIGTTPAPDISKYLEISTPATAVSRVDFQAGDTNYNY